MNLNYRAAIAAIVVVLSVSPITVANQAEADSQIARDAREAEKEAFAALRAKDYALAADRFETAAKLWEKLQASGDERSKAARGAQRCRKNYVYALHAPLSAELDNAKRLASQGRSLAASEKFLALVGQYDRVIQRCDARIFRQNRKYCAANAGLVLIRQADKYRESGEFTKAAEFYALAVRQYGKVHELLGRELFSGNIGYAEQQYVRVDLAARVEQHAAAPPFDLPSLVAGHVTLKESRGKTTLLVFWAAWCGYCRKDLPILDAFQRKIGPDRLAVVGLCLDRIPSWNRRQADRARELVRSLSFPNAWCDNDTLRAYGAPPAVPTAYWIDRNGRFVKPASLEDLSLEKLTQQFREVDSRPMLDSRSATAAE